MENVKIAQTSELSPGSKKLVSLEGKVILLANIDGTYYAVDNTCPHMGGSLYEGDLEGSNIVCPRHGSIFDIRTGKVVQSGKILFLKVKVNDIRRYPVIVEGSDIYIEVK
ncbi:MAG: Rieske (2Fe-2S) protein [Saccharofermentanales bacterium]